MTSIQADMNRRPSNAEGEDHLTALPNELLATIVEQLPVREICRLRSLSRHFRDFVDTNQGLLTQELINCHRTRINREYTNLTDLSDCDIVDALRRYDNYYGLECDEPAIIVAQASHPPFKVAAVSLDLQLNWTRSHGPIPTGRGARATQWIGLYCMLRDMENLLRRDRILEHIWTNAYPALLAGSAEAEEFVAKFTELVSTRARVSYEFVPRFFLTRRKVYGFYGSGRRETHEGHCDDSQPSKLQLLLGLPDLQLGDGTLAYCSMFGDAIELVDEVDQGPSTVLKQAAIIEDVFIWR